MRIVVLTSCTGKKAISHERALKLDDFQQGPIHVAVREQELAEYLTPAGELYTGLQHVRLMRGVRAIRQSGKVDLDLHILSAGYGLIPEDRKLPPYECTFRGMRKAEIREWGDALGVPQAFNNLMAQPYDLALVLLGDKYTQACNIDATLVLGGPTVFLCGGKVAKSLPQLPDLHKVVLTNDDAGRSSCGQIGLKGEVAARWLEHWAEKPEDITAFCSSI